MFPDMRKVEAMFKELVGEIKKLRIEVRTLNEFMKEQRDKKGE